MSKRVAVLISTLDGGGAIRSMFKLAQGLAAHGYRVDLLICRSEGTLAQQLPEETRNIYLRRGSTLAGRFSVLKADPGGVLYSARPMLLPYKSPWPLRYLPSLADYLKENRPDMLFSGGTFFNLISLWARRLARVNTRLVVMDRSSFSANIKQRPNQWRRKYLSSLVRHAYAWADEIVAVSNDAAEDLSRTAGIDRARIKTIYNPVVTDDIAIKASEPVEHDWLNDPAIPVVLAAGLFVEQKDFPTLLRAFARARAQREMRLIILGKGKAPRRQELETLAEHLGIRDDVSLPGWADNPYSYMRNASVFVLSSLYEGLPGVLIQALACGCPVVSTDCPTGPREILCEGEYGPLVPVGDDEALAKAILSVVDNPLESKRLQERAAFFSMERATAQYLELCLENR